MVSNLRESKKPGGFGTESETFMEGSQSQGIDFSVDSLALEEYDYYEELDPV